MLWYVLFLPLMAPTVFSQPSLIYLKGIVRLNDSDYHDFYFCCNTEGALLQWEYNYERLSGFRDQDAGLVVVETRSTFEFTATLLSSQLDPATKQRRLDSVLVISFTGPYPNNFEVTCSSNSEFVSTRVNGLKGDVSNRSSSLHQVVLDHIVTDNIVQNRSTHILACGTQSEQQFYEINRRPIGFTQYDSIGRDQTTLSQDGNVVNTQGVFIALNPYRRTTLLFIADNADITVVCYFGTAQAQLHLNKKTGEEFTTNSQALLPTIPITTTGNNSSKLHVTTSVLSSTVFATDNAGVGVGFNGGTVIVVTVVALLLLLAAAVLIITCLVLRKKGSKAKSISLIENSSGSTGIRSNDPLEPGTSNSRDKLQNEVTQNSHAEDTCMSSDGTVSTNRRTSEDCNGRNSLEESSTTVIVGETGTCTLGMSLGSSPPLEKEVLTPETKPDETFFDGCGSEGSSCNEDIETDGRVAVIPSEESNSMEESLRGCSNSLVYHGFHNYIASWNPPIEPDLITNDEILWMPLEVEFSRLTLVNGQTRSQKKTTTLGKVFAESCPGDAVIIAAGNIFEMVHDYIWENNYNIKNECIQEQCDKGEKSEEKNKSLCEENPVNFVTSESMVQVASLSSMHTSSFGVVLPAMVKYGNFTCAAKKLHDTVVQQSIKRMESMVSKYHQECQLMSRLHHPNITMFLGICILPDVHLPLLVTEQLEINHNDLFKSVPNRLFSQVMSDVGSALDYLHSRELQVIHGDLTAKNVLLTSSLSAKIADMGNFHIVSMRPFQLARTLHHLPGTLEYMPPEILSNDHRYGAPLDIFSCGLILLDLMQMQKSEENTKSWDIVGLAKYNFIEKYHSLQMEKISAFCYDFHSTSNRMLQLFQETERKISWAIQNEDLEHIYWSIWNMHPPAIKKKNFKVAEELIAKYDVNREAKSFAFTCFVKNSLCIEGELLRHITIGERIKNILSDFLNIGPGAAYTVSGFQAALWEPSLPITLSNTGQKLYECMAELIRPVKCIFSTMSKCYIESSIFR